MNNIKYILTTNNPQGYYLRSFDSIKIGKNIWNNAAFVGGIFWLYFRKMHAPAFFISIIMYITIILSNLLLYVFDFNMQLYNTIFVIFSTHVFLGFFGNKLYYKNIKAKIKKGYHLYGKYTPYSIKLGIICTCCNILGFIPNYLAYLKDKNLVNKAKKLFNTNKYVLTDANILRLISKANDNYYLYKFEHIKNHKIISTNLYAFIFGKLWFIYKKMYLHALIIGIIELCLIFFWILDISAIKETHKIAFDNHCLIPCLIVIFINRLSLGLRFANAFYYKKLDSESRNPHLPKDFIPIIHSMAEHNNVNAAASLGAYYLNNHNNTPDNQSLAYKWTKLAAEKGCAFSQYLMFYFLYYGYRDIEPNQNKAMFWLLKSADHGFPLAQRELGNHYHNGKIFSQDFERAYHYYMLAASNDDFTSHAMIGYMYENGEFITKDINKAIEHYKISADNGLSIAQSILGDIYWQGKIIAKDLETSIDFYKGSLENNDASNLSDVYFKIGICYQEIGQYDESISWLQKSVKLGNSEAIVFLCFSCSLSKDIKHKDVELLYNTVAADINTSNPDYIFALAYCNEKGLETKIDYKKAFELYKKAAKFKHIWAIYHMSHLYHFGLGTTINYEKSIKLLESIIDKSAAAKYILGLYYLRGHGVEQNTNRAHLLIKEAAQDGYAAAYNLLETLNEKTSL